MRTLKGLACCCALLLLGACSITRLGYNHLDTLLRWQVSEYVDLDTQQQQMFNAELQRVWIWHRHTQLPVYAAELRQLAGQVRADVIGREQIDASSARITGYWKDLVAQALPGYAGLNAALGDAQVADLIRRIGKEVERKARKRQKLSVEERRQHRIDAMNDTLRDWIGRPTARQRQLVEQWADATQLTPAEQTQRQQARLERYAALLASRSEPGFEQRMGIFILDPEPGDGVQSPDVVQRDRWLQLLADIAPTLEPAQRERLCKRLLGYAADFEALAAEQPKAKTAATS